MSDHTITETEEELRDNLNDVNDMLDEFDRQQRELDEERALLTDQVQGALAEYEARVSDYEQKRNALDQRQADLNTNRQEFVESRDWIEMQLEAKQDAKAEQGLGADPAGPKSTEPGEAPGPNEPRPMATKEQVEKLEAARDQPSPDLTMDPPGMQSQSDQINRDLQQMIDAKKGQLSQASDKLKTDWKHSTGPKR